LRKLLLAFAVLLCFIYSPVFSQSQNEENGTANVSANGNGNGAAADTTVYIINSFDYNIDGITRRFAIRNAADLKIGEIIIGFYHLENYIQEKTQLLVNQRVLETASIDYTIGEAQEDGIYPVDLVINTKDSRNMVALPLPQYSSNSGYKLTIKARDYNFLGTMNALRVDFGIRYDQEDRLSTNFMIDSDTPFEAFDLDWEFNFDHDFEYRPDMSQHYYYKNVTGILVRFPIGRTTLTTGFNESFIYNEENADSDKPVYGDFQDGLYMSSNPYLLWVFPIPITIGRYDNLTYVPTVSAVFNHELSKWPLDNNRKGPSLIFGHSLGFGRRDWIGNFLRGYTINVSNYNGYNFYNRRNNIRAYSSSLSVTGSMYFTFIDTFGIYSRLNYRHVFHGDYNSSAGDVMRGILDSRIRSDLMFSLNIDLAVKLWKIRPAYWFDTPQFRLFDMDLHFVPFFDIAANRDPFLEITHSGEPFHYKNLLLSSGVEFIFFPIRFRSLFLRASIGFNLSSMSDLGKYELFIGTDLHY
jgi:hypothetical protein